MITKSLISDDERAVSPVIGVILMVAITVILAAVIGTFVLGLGDSVSQSPQAGVTLSEQTDGSNTDVVVTITSADRVDEITIQRGSSGEFSGDASDTGTTSVSLSSPSAGDEVTVEAAGSSETVTVVGTLDGNEAVLNSYQRN